MNPTQQPANDPFLRMIDFADINSDHKVLIPAASKNYALTNTIVCKDLCLVDNPHNAIVLNNQLPERDFDPKVSLGNFLEMGEDDLGLFDRILAQLPMMESQKFSVVDINLHIDYIMKMYNLLEYGGRLVCLTTNTWDKEVVNAEQLGFRNWLNSLGTFNYKVMLAEGHAYRKSTADERVIVVIDKEIMVTSKKHSEKQKQDSIKILIEAITEEDEEQTLDALLDRDWSMIGANMNSIPDVTKLGAEYDQTLALLIKRRAALRDDIDDAQSELARITAKAIPFTSYINKVESFLYSFSGDFFLDRNKIKK